MGKQFAEELKRLEAHSRSQWFPQPDPAEFAELLLEYKNVEQLRTLWDSMRKRWKRDMELFEKQMLGDAGL